MPAMVTTQDSSGWLRPRSRVLRRWPLRPLRDLLAAEQDRWVLWLPVFYAAGIGGYFLLASEPPSWLGPAAATVAGLALAVLALLRHRLPVAVTAALLPMLLLLAGFGVAQWRAQAVAAPVLQRETGPVHFLGRVIQVEPYEKAGHWRVTLADLHLQSRGRNLPAPGRVRLNVRTGGIVPVAGQAASGPGDSVPAGAAGPAGRLRFRQDGLVSGPRGRRGHDRPAGGGRCDRIAADRHLAGSRQCGRPFAADPGGPHHGGDGRRRKARWRRRF